MKTRITNLINSLNKGLEERQEAIAIVLLSALAQQNTFLLGMPGTAKSLLARRISKAFKDGTYYEHLMHKFCTPKDIFGPESIPELKEGKYKTLTEGYLPSADIAFLDEIWKSSPAILNTLLTIINEKKFMNGSESIKVPLKFVVSASNETPSESCLNAIYDRFATRVLVKPIERREHFEAILQNGVATENVEIKEEDKISNEEYEGWQKEIAQVKISKECFDIIQSIKVAIDKHNKNEKEKIAISDRRWQKAAYIMKASAFFCDRKETNVADSLLLSYCLWSSEKDYEFVRKTVENAVKCNGVDLKMSIATLEERAEKLNKEITELLYYTEDIYDTVKLNSEDKKEYIKVLIPGEVPALSVYLPLEDVFKKQSDEWEYPIDKEGNKVPRVLVKYNKGSYSIRVRQSNGYYSSSWRDFCEDETPKIKYNKGARRPDRNGFLKKGLSEVWASLKKDCQAALNDFTVKYEALKKANSNPFISDEKLQVAFKGALDQQKNLNALLKKCELLNNKIEGDEGVN